MKPTRVLVFPSCNEPGLEVIDALDKHPRIEVFGGSSFDLEADASRLLLGDRHFRLPALGETDFREKLDAFCSDHGIDFVFPTVDSVVAELAGWRGVGFTVISPRADLAQLVLSKSAVYAAVSDTVAVPRSWTQDLGFPAFAKPDVGSGSRGAVRLDSPEDVDRAHAAGLLVQEFLPGREFTVDCVSDAAGALIACSVRERVAIAGGIARASRCIAHPGLSAAVREIARALPLAGPWFAQFREDRDGQPRLMEVNARVGGSSGASRLCGLNCPLMAVLAFGDVPLEAPPVLCDQLVIRRLDRRGDVDDFDWVIWDLDDTLTTRGGIVDAELAAWLYRFENRGKRQLLVSRNRDPAGVVVALKLPDFFVEIVRTDDKVPTVRALLSRYAIAPERAVMINDSNSEKLAFAAALPLVRTVTPDAVGLLAG